jgi:hypothetical protein
MPWHELDQDFIEYVSTLSLIRRSYPSIALAHAFDFVFENQLLKLRFLHAPIECWINIQSKPVFVNVDDLITKTYVVSLPPFGVLITHI